MNLKQILSYFIKHYKNFEYQKKHVDFKNNSLVHFANNISSKIKDIAVDNLECDASVGKGGWGMTPWIRFYDEQYAPSATKGLYLVYLFDDCMNKVYLSLNRGITDFKRYKHRTKDESLLSSAFYARTKINEIEKHQIADYIDDEPLKLNLIKDIETTNRTREYQEANIFSICYKCSDIINDSSDINNRLINDLNYMNHLYNDLKPFASELNSDKAKVYHQFKGRIIKPVSVPNNIMYKKYHRISKPMSSKPHDYLKIHKNNMTIGDYGEYIVMLLERRHYKHYHQIKVRHRSKETNDHVPYDIDIFNTKTKTILKKIEVKTTKTSYKRASFHISKNEVSCLVKDPGKYILARIYNLKDGNSPINYFFISGEYLLNHLLFTPSSYNVTFNQPSKLDKNNVINYAKK